LWSFNLALTLFTIQILWPISWWGFFAWHSRKSILASIWNFGKIAHNLPIIGNFECSQNISLLLTITLSNVDRFSKIVSNFNIESNVSVTLLLAITESNVDQFSHFFHTSKKNYHSKTTHVIFFTTPLTLFHTTATLRTYLMFYTREVFSPITTFIN